MNMEIVEPRSGVVSGELTCGWLDERNQLHQTFVVNEMTGVEEDLLAGKGAVLPRLNRVIANCLESIGGITDKSVISRAVDGLTATDRMLLLVAIRRASLGDNYDTKIKCPSCGKESSITVGLSNLETRKMVDPTQRRISTTLSTGLVVQWHIMTGQDEEWLQGLRKRPQTDNDLLTLALLARVDAIGDTVVNRVTNLNGALGLLKGLRSRERNELRNLFSQTEGFVDTNVEYECPSCGEEFRGDLDVAQTGFFFPQGSSKP
jgi:predicted RNA-binding Zn-ribbon protein involved in translation (DUF1610 family)